MRSRGWLFWGALAIAFVGCSSLSYYSDYDKQADFSVYRSFTWIGGNFEPAEGGALASSGAAMIETQVRRAVESNLAAMGFTIRNEGESDMLIAYYAGAKDQVDTSPTDYGYAYGRWAYSDVQVKSYREGTLIIDLIDAERNELVWRGWATGTIQDNLNAEQRAKRIDDAVAKIMENYPPRR
jgi:hypothetical protein